MADETGIPSWTLASITAGDGIPVGEYTVREITIATMALLIRVKSPLASETEPKRAEDWFPTLYILTRPAKESARLLAKGGEVFAEAVEDWADTLHASAFKPLVEAARAVMERANSAADGDGDGSDEEPKGPPVHAATAG